MQRFTRLLAMAAAAAVIAAPCSGVNVQVQPDGRSYAAVIDHGPSAIRYDIVFVGDGFTSAEQSLFNNKVDEAVDALRNRIPYSTRMCAFNIWRVNVVSQESGVDHPAGNVFKNTELDCTYGDPAHGEAERCIQSDSPAKCFEAADFAPDYDAVFVLVNDTQWGGCAGGLVFSSIAPGFARTITHELGHKIGGLADEYTCYVCDGSDDDRSYGGGEPGQPNVTIETDPALIKWKTYVAAGTPLPTTVNNPAGVVGLWEGAMYNAKDIYRPQFICHMRNSGSEFCAVCRDVMAERLESHCLFCELNPQAAVCAFIDLRDRFRLIPDWHRFRWTIPICPRCPVCLTCPFDKQFFEDIEMRLRDVPRGATLTVFDHRGEQVAQGAGQGTLTVRFKARRDTQYFAELQGEKVTEANWKGDVGIQLLRDGKVQELAGSR